MLGLFIDRYNSSQQVKVHQLPGDVMTADLKESVDEFSLNGRVATCDFHPAAANVRAPCVYGIALRTTA